MTLFVSKCEISRDFKEEHPLNILLILVILFVFQFDKFFISNNVLQSSNNEHILDILLIPFNLISNSLFFDRLYSFDLKYSCNW